MQSADKAKLVVLQRMGRAGTHSDYQCSPDHLVEQDHSSKSKLELTQVQRFASIITEQQLSPAREGWARILESKDSEKVTGVDN